MWRYVKSAAVCLGFVAAGMGGGFQLRAQAPAAPADTAAMRANYDRWRTEYKTWNRWGAEDNKGTSNLITPQKVLSAIKLVKSGTVISLAAADVNAAGVFHRTT